MSDKRTNGAGDPSEEDEAGSAGETSPEVAADSGDDEEIPVEVDAADVTRPVKVPDLGAAFDAGAAGEGEAAGADRAGLSAEDLLELLGQAETEKASFEARIAELEAEKKEYYERLLRSAADMENLRKRTRKEVDDARLDARGKALKEMLPVIDNLDRAVHHAQSASSDAAGIIEGVELVLRQFAQALERCEVRAIDAAGKPFDPNIHEAVSQIESAEHAPGTVVEVLQRGYTLGPRLLRASLVVVASAQSKPAAAPTPMPPADEDAGNGAGEAAEAAPDDGAAPPAEGGEGSEPEQEA